MTNAFIISWLAVLGACLGSFINVVALRDDNRKSIVAGRSECPHCHHMLAWYDLVPVLSFLTLGAKCRYCKKPISPRYVVVELLAAAIIAGLGLYVLPKENAIQLLVGLGISTLLLFVISLVDLQTFEVSTEYALAAGAIGFLTMGFSGERSWIELVLGVLYGAGSIAAILYGWKLLFKQDGMGVGDIWIAGAIGAILGFPDVLVALSTAVFLGAVIGSIYAAFSKKGLQAAIPFGPFLFAGFVVALIWGQSIVQWYILYV